MQDVHGCECALAFFESVVTFKDVVVLQRGFSMPPRQPSSRLLASRRLGRASRGDSLASFPSAELARAYLVGEDVYLGQGRWWRWERDGVPGWLAPFLEETGLLGA